MDGVEQKEFRWKRISANAEVLCEGDEFIGGWKGGERRVDEVDNIEDAACSD